MGKLLFRTLLLLTIGLAQASAALAQDTAVIPDSTGYPGDHFSLEGAIVLFEKAESPEAFEKMLNSDQNQVNNLDLNEDGKVDYIRVIDHVEGDDHVIVLQVPVNEKESQDIAVIEIERQGDEKAILQIIGDEDVFGQNTIVEPFDEETDASKNKGRGGPSLYGQRIRIVVNVWPWPVVRFMYAPVYRPWVSPYRWAYYPPYWRPWRPYPYRTFRVGFAPYYRRCHVVTTHRVVRAHRVYTPRRTHSTVVRTRTTTVTRHKHGGRTTVQQRTTTTRSGKAPAKTQRPQNNARKGNPGGNARKGNPGGAKKGGGRGRN